MTDLELADWLYRWRESLRCEAPCQAAVCICAERTDQIIAALRRGHEPSVTCPLCEGTGQRDVVSFVDSSKTVKNSCSACKGKGVITSERPPSGEMVMVPREPTEDMIITGRRFCGTDSIFVIGFYRAMLSAAEAPKEAK